MSFGGWFVSCFLFVSFFCLLLLPNIGLVNDNQAKHSRTCWFVFKPLKIHEIWVVLRLRQKLADTSTPVSNTAQQQQKQQQQLTLRNWSSSASVSPPLLPPQNTLEGLHVCFFCSASFPQKFKIQWIWVDLNSAFVDLFFFFIVAVAWSGLVNDYVCV